LVVLTISMFLGIASFSAIGVKQSLNSKISCLFGSKFATNLGGDRLDQQQTECNDALLLDGYWAKQIGHTRWAVHKIGYGFYQFFVPNIHSKEITRVSLYVAKIEEPPGGLGITVYGVVNVTNNPSKPDKVYIALDNATKVTIIIPSYKISKSYNWVEFDFPDIKVNKFYQYYCLYIFPTGHLELGKPSTYYSIGCYKGEDLYDKGNLFYSGGGIGILGRVCKLIPDSDLTFKTYAKMENKAPGKPTIDGPTKGKKGETYSYIAKAKDPEGDQIYYFFDWGDGTNTGWLGPYPSNQPVSAHHTWYGVGKYSIRVKAKDDFGEDDYGNIGESEWSDPLVVSISKNKKVLNHVFLKDLSLIKQLLNITRLVR